MVTMAQLAKRQRELAEEAEALRKKGLELDRREEALGEFFRDSAITAFMESNPTADYREALLDVSKKHPEYFALQLAPKLNAALGQELDEKIRNFQEAHPDASYGQSLIEIGSQLSEYSDLMRAPVPEPEKANTDKLRDKEITKFQEAHPEVSYSEAFIAVSKSFPQYFEI